MPAAIHHYTKEEFQHALSDIGIASGDVVSLQLSLGRLGLPKGPASFDEIADMVIEMFLDAIGPEGTLIVPCYTYSIGRGEAFEVESTPSSIGPFPELFRRREKVVRSRDPMLSTCGLGPMAPEILLNLSNSCYGDNSVFHQLRKYDAKICTLGISLYWATFRHHIEEIAQVPFRFVKMFRGTVIENSVSMVEDWHYFAAPLNLANCEPNGLPLEKLARDANLVKVATIGRGEIMQISARSYFDFGPEKLRENPWLTANGPPCDIAPHISQELENAAT